MGDQITGGGYIVWFSDGRQKQRYFADPETFLAELTRIRKYTPPRAIVSGMINWEKQTVDMMVDDETAL